MAASAVTDHDNITWLCCNTSPPPRSPPLVDTIAVFIVDQQRLILLKYTAVISHQLTNWYLWRPLRRWVYSDWMNASAAMTAHRPLPSTAQFISKFGTSIRYEVFAALRGLPSTFPCSMIFGSVSWRHTWPNHESLRRWTVDSESSWRPVGYRLGGRE